MATIEIYAVDWCPWCKKAKAILRSHGLSYIEYNAENDMIRREMRSRSGRTSVPQIFIDGKHIGGHDDLVAFAQKGGLLNLHHKRQ